MPLVFVLQLLLPFVVPHHIKCIIYTTEAMVSQSIIHSTFLVQLLEVDVFQVKIRSVLPHSSLLTVNLDSFMDILRSFELDDSVTGQVRIALGIYSSFRASLGVGSLGKQCSSVRSKVGASNF